MTRAKRLQRLFDHEYGEPGLAGTPESAEGIDVGDIRHLEHHPAEVGLKVLDSVDEFLRELSRYSGINIDDSLIKEVEGLIALYITLLGSKDYLSMTSALFLYVRSHFDRSITKEVIGYIKSFLFPFESQSGDEKAPGWMKMLREAKYDWAVCKGNRLFDHFSKLLGLFVTLGLCKASNVTFRLHDFKLCEPDLTILHGSASDIVDAIFGTVTFFVEGLYSCFKHRSLKPLWIGNSVTTELDEEYSTIVGWWDLVKNGNLERVTREYGFEIKISEFDRRLEGLCTKLRNMLSSIKGFEKKLIADKYLKLLTIKNDYITKRISSGIRKAPFAIELFGASNQGKSTFGDQLVDALLLSTGAQLGKEYRASYNPNDEFMSNWTTDKTVLLFDDLANEKSTFVQKPPTRAIIDVCNNEPFYANKAELDAKGKVFVEPLIAVVTTNVKDLDSYCYSNCPYSVQRRMNMVISVEAKKEFQIIIDGSAQGVDSTKIRKKYTINGIYTPPVFDDIWELTVERAMQPKQLDEVAGYGVVHWRGVTLKKVPMRLVMQYAIEMFAEHQSNQESLIESMCSRTGNLVRCDIDGCKQICGYCDEHDHVRAETPLEAHIGEELADATLRACNLIGSKFRTDLEVGSRAYERAVTLLILGAATSFVRRWDWLNFVPSQLVERLWFVRLVSVGHMRYMKFQYFLTSLMIWSFFLFHLWFMNYMQFDDSEFWFYFSIFSVLCVVGQRKVRDDVIKCYRRELLARNSIHPVLQVARDKHILSVCSACGVLGVLYALSKVYKRYRMLNPQGSLEPKTMEEVMERDAEASPWVSVVARDLPITPISKTVTKEVLQDVVERNLVYATVCTASGKKLMGNGLFLKSNVVVLPSHYFEEEVLDVTFRKINPDSCGGKFAARLSLGGSIKVPNTDLCLCYCPNGGSFRDITKHFPTEPLPKHPFSMIYRQKTGDMIIAKGLADPQVVTTRVPNPTFYQLPEYKFEGGLYTNLTIDTFSGLCGAVLISDTHGCVISGFHLGGASNTPRGCYGSLKQSDIHSCMEKLRQIDGVLFSGTAEKFDVQVLGVNVVDTSAEPHKKSAIYYMPKDSQVVYHGGCSGRATSHSQVRVTPISEHVMDVCNKPNVWGPPKMKPEWFGWQTCLENLSVPALPYPHELLVEAVKDYKCTLEPLFKDSIWSQTSPLCDEDNVNGIPGQKFMDAIKSNTAIGYPLTGIKSKHMVDLPSTARHPHKKTFQPHIWEHISKVEDSYRRGERAYEIAKAQKKDEITPTAKEKCRIFYGNSVALTFLIRKYYLPIIRVMQMNPLISECAVGINCHGPEWDKLHDHVLKYGSDRLFGGDYGKYDQKLPAQVLLASFRILIDMAKLCNYNEVDLKIMEAMTGDIVYALIAFDGDLIGLIEGAHISGNSLTVVLNGIGGSLNCRCFFFTLFPRDKYKTGFQEAVSLITYGDDNLGSVREGFEDFNIKSFSEFLGNYGQIYTMPSKDSDLRKFLDFTDFEFLKRKTVYHKSLGVHVGALCEDSIFKSLHCFMREKKSPLTVEMACAINIDGALREWFNHGKSLYDIRRSQMISVANRAGISHMCETLHLTYDDRVGEWYDRYVYKTKKPEKPALFDLE